MDFFPNIRRGAWRKGDVGHKGGLINLRPRRGQCRAGLSDTGGPPMPRKRAPRQKKTYQLGNTTTPRTITEVKHR